MQNQNADPNNDNNQNQPDHGDQQPKQVTISADTWKKTQDTLLHLNNGFHNLDTKLENMQKSGKAGKSSNGQPDNGGNSNNDNDDNKPDYNELLNKVNTLTSRISAKDEQAKLTDYAKKQLSKQGLRATSSDLKHIMGKDTNAIDDNIKWFAKLAKNNQSNPTHLQKQPHHSKKVTDIGKKLSEEYKSQSNALDHYKM